MSAPRFKFTGTITPGSRDFYEENGFIVFKQVFSPSEVRTIADEAQALEQRTLADEIPPERRDRVLKPSQDEQGKTYLHRLSYFTHYCQMTAELIQARGLGGIGTGLLGPAAWRLEDTMGGSTWQLKRGGKSNYSSIAWHVDFPEGHILNPIVSVGIYLDASREDNGALLVIPGSHVAPQGRMPTSHLAVEAEPGDVICHAYNILHASGPMKPGSQRATLYLYYCGGIHPGAWKPFASDEQMQKGQNIFEPASTGS